MSQDISGKTGFQLKSEWIKGQGVDSSIGDRGRPYQGSRVTSSDVMNSAAVRGGKSFFLNLRD